jgi:plasmid stabilization system protein ParE
MYDVRWSDRADDELANAWLAAADRNAVNQTADRVEELLARDPLGQGESRSGNVRLLYEAPLAVLYRVLPDAQVVWVVTLRLDA